MREWAGGADACSEEERRKASWRKERNPGQSSHRPSPRKQEETKVIFKRMYETL